ncbi:MAG: hypothetical protein M1832_000942 [Thelocarpon impressellum]|nr:MAG: hypothetical protein M1832_000942 [Thelocarpon impressellum]
MAPQVPPKPRIPPSPRPSTLDPTLRSQINAALLEEGHIDRIHSTLSTNLHSTPFPAQVRAQALALLRAGECTTFPALLEEVARRVREANARPLPPATTTTTTAAAEKKRERERDGDINGTGLVNGHSPAPVAAVGVRAGEPGEIDLRVPARVVEAGVAAVREALAEVVDVVED